MSTLHRTKVREKILSSARQVSIFRKVPGPYVRPRATRAMQCRSNFACLNPAACQVCEE